MVSLYLIVLLVFVLQHYSISNAATTGCMSVTDDSEVEWWFLLKPPDRNNVFLYMESKKGVETKLQVSGHFISMLVTILRSLSHLSEWKITLNTTWK